MLAGVGSFDLIILSHVVGHGPDPSGFLTNEAVTLLSSHGVVYADLPGLRSIARYGDPGHYFQNAPPMELPSSR